MVRAIFRCIVLLLLTAFVHAAELPKVTRAFIEAHCMDCHDADSARAGFRIDLLSDDFMSGNTAGQWKEVMDKINSGEMPPRKRKVRPDPKDAFAVSSLFAGLGGALLAYELPALSPQQFMVVGALAVLALCYLGGIATLSGALIAGVLASGGVLTQLQGGATGNASSYQFALSGVVLIAVAIFSPDGVIVALRNGLARLRGTR